MSRLDQRMMPLTLSIPQTPMKQSVTFNYNPAFTHPPRFQPLLARIKESLMSPVKTRFSITPPDIAVDSILLLLTHACDGLNTIGHSIPGLEKLYRQLIEFADTLEARRDELEGYLDTTIMMATVPPRTATTVNPGESPLVQHPFTRPQTGVVTIKHWIYDLQKNVWLLNEKTIRYETSMTTILNQGARKRKLDMIGYDVHTSWVNLMLHLGLVISQQSAKEQSNNTGRLASLAVATGMTDVIDDLGNNDVARIYMQGEKHLLGYGVTQSFGLAFTRFEVAARLGSTEASNMLGVMLEFGIGCTKDIASALKYYKSAAHSSFPDAINHLARIYEVGKGCEVDTKTAHDLYKKASGLGNVDGTTNYAYTLEHGIGCQQNKVLAFETYKIGADAGYAKSQNSLGSCYYRGVGCKRDYSSACVMFKKAVDQGYAHAQNNLGICYEEGNGIPRDMNHAKILYKSASDQNHGGGSCNLGYMLLLEYRYLEAIEKLYLAKTCGDVEAIFLLGYLFETGCADKDGTILTQDLDMALRLYRQAGKLGSRKSLLRYASILICGPQRLIDIPRAVKALLLAASDIDKGKGGAVRGSTSSLDHSRFIGCQGSADAQNMLGELCEIGMHDTLESGPDIEKALSWYRLALKQGHDRAMFNLGAMYEKGSGVDKDLFKAVRLYREAEKLGNEDAIARLVEMKNLGILSSSS